MAESDLFEEMLATYPAEKRELAREVFHRFADGDSTQFFTQLLLVLDVYARYVERIPKAAVQANQDSFAISQDTREEIAMIAKTIEARDVNITNHAAKTDELCKITQAKCDETVASIELMLKNLGSQVDTKAIVKGIEDAMKNIFLPLHVRASDLAHTVGPTVEKLNAAAARAAQLWPQRIWKTALTAGVIVGLAVAALGIGATYWQMKRHFDKTLADEIRTERYTLKNNKDAFQQLATADVPVYVARSSDSSGNIIPRGYCLYIQNAQGADMKDGTGRIFFISSRPESELKQLLDVQQQQ
ncbi:MAG: hypothetical protein WBW41_18335 [Verrucomicrobiia bacterium]